MDLKPGQVGWFDISVPDAEALKDFYSRVVGWKTDPVEMEGYNDHCVIPPGTDAPVGGICHARGSNAELPPQWLIYITVADLDESLRQVKELGGSVIGEIRDYGASRYAPIRDPAGAACVLFQNVEEPA